MYNKAKESHDIRPESMMFWTPKILPPHPSTIPTLSPLAENVLAMIRQEMDCGGGNRRDTSYGATVSDSLHGSGWNPMNVQRTRMEVVDGHVESFDHHSQVGMNPHISLMRHHKRKDEYPMAVSTNLFPPDAHLPNSEINFGNPQVSSINLQRECSDTYSYNQLSQNELLNSPFKPIDDIRKNGVRNSQTYSLSPDMEFDDMEVFSCPFDNKEVDLPNKIFEHGSNMALARKNTLNFKEVKPRHLQKRGLQIDTPLPLIVNYGKNKTLLLKNLEPSDQTFVFASTNSVPKFKKRLASFKNSTFTKPTSKIPFNVKDCNNASSQVSVLNKIDCEKINVNNAKAVNFSNASSVGAEKENFEIDDIFDESFKNVFSNLEQEDKNDKHTMRNVTQDIKQHFKKKLPDSCKDSPHSTYMSTNFQGHSTEVQENQGAKVSTKHHELIPSNFVTHVNHVTNFNQKSYPSLDFLAKNRVIEDNKCNNTQNIVNETNKPKPSEEKKFLLHMQSFGNNTETKSIRYQQLDLSQDLFAITQESTDCSQNKAIEIEANQSEECSLTPYQKAIENSGSPDFDVDDLFSLENKSHGHSFDVLKEDFGNKNILKSSRDNFKCLPTNKEIKVNNLNPTEITFKENFNVNSSLPFELMQMSQNNDGESLKDGSTSSSTRCFPVVKSPYFRAPSKNPNPDHKLISMEASNLKQNFYETDNGLGSEKVKNNKVMMQNSTVRENMKNRMELDVGVVKGNFKTKNLTAKRSLKQATLFDYQELNLITNNEGSINKNNQETQVKTPLQIDKFKMPLPPVEKGKKSTKFHNVKNKKSSNINSDKKSNSNSDGIGFLQSNTTMEEIKQKCDPSKMVQTTLVKNKPVKRSTEQSLQQKNCKKPCFVPPIAASHSTSKEVSLNKYTITVLDDINASQILQQLNSEDINNVVTTVTFKEGYTLLNKPEDHKKNSRCFPSGVMYMIVWDNGRLGYYWLPLSDPTSITPAVAKLVDTLMSKSERNVCFEAQAVYMLLMDTIKLKEISNWNAYDPLIASWLLDPDNPPKDFRETLEKLNMDGNLLIVNPQANTRDQACDLLPVLDVAMNIMQNRLVNASLWTVFTDMETKLIPILAVMEGSSILVDIVKLHRTAEVMDKKLRGLQSEAHKLADRWFQLNSPQQLREILFDELKLDEKFNLKVKKTEQGEKSTSETVLEQMKELHPLPKIILEYRRLQKLKSTYVDGLLQHVRSDGTIGTSWEQVSAATGRITSKNPNLQAFPKCPINIQGGETIHLREMFKARDGCSFLAADFQQIELRVFAHFTQDRSLLQAFREGGDIFQTLAERWLGGRGEEEREKTKRIVYSVMYGAGANKLSEYLHVKPADAHKIIDNFVAIFPSLRSLPRTVVANCRTQGFVSTLSGRRRLFPHIRSTNGKLRSYSERQAMNFLIQGSAADICKAAMLDCEAEIRSRGLRAKLLLMIHDELIWEVDDRDLQETSKTVKLAMEHRWNERLTLHIPIPVCVTVGKTLANMQSLDAQ